MSCHIGWRLAQTDTQFLNSAPLGNLTSMLTKTLTLLAFNSCLISTLTPTFEIKLRNNDMSTELTNHLISKCKNKIDAYNIKRLITWPGYSVLIASLFNLLNWDGVASNFKAIFGRVSYDVTWRFQTTRKIWELKLQMFWTNLC